MKQAFTLLSALVLFLLSPDRSHAQPSQPTISIAGGIPLRPGATVTLTAPGGYSAYQWTRNNVDVVGTSVTLSVSNPGYYRVRVTDGSGATISNPVRVTAQNAAGSPDKNYTQEDVILQEGIRSENEVDLVQTKKNRIITYADGLLIPIQQVDVQASPAGEDIIQPMEYNTAGQQVKQYLPYTGTKPNAGWLNGDYRSNYQQEQQSFYSGADRVAKVPNNETFAETVYEDTPTGSVIETGAPGAAWKIAKDGNNQSTFQGHTKRTILRTNVNVEVALWSYVPGAEGVVGTATTTISDAQTLSVTHTTDEDGKGNWKYINLLGQLVAEEVVASPGVYLTTAYAYDALGRVIMIMSPEGVKRRVNNGEALNNDFLAKWAYLYQYDERGRPIAKKIPGRDWLFTVFDRWDRPVATQNGNQRSQYKWSYIKYNSQNRAIITGQIVDTRSRKALSNSIESDIASGILTRYEVRAVNNLGSVTIGYSCDKTFPKNPPSNELMSVNYYDDYDFLSSLPTTLSYQQEPTGDVNGISSPSTASTRTVGFPTITQKKVLGSSTTQWLVNAIYYDDRGKPVQTVAQNHLSGVDRITTEYDFVGKVLKVLTTHSSTGYATHSIQYRHVYRNDNSLDAIYAWFDRNTGSQEVLLSKKEYNELGQLVDDKLGQYDATNNRFLQSIDYRYNIRGWLEKINDRNITGRYYDAQSNTIQGQTVWLGTQTPNDDLDARKDLFGLELVYDEGGPTGTQPNYNGNISATMWHSASPANNKLRSYAYSYDQSNRLTAGRYAGYNYVNGAWGWEDEKDDRDGTGRFTTSGVEYDLNGNIKKLNRNGQNAGTTSAPVYGPIDQLSYEYIGNQLVSVQDLVPTTVAPNDFENRASSTTEYEYDANGNMTVDRNKGITVTYNELNLPLNIVFANNNRITYQYLADGTKLKQSFSSTTGTGQNVDYAGGFVYGESPSYFITTPVGRALYDASRPQNDRWVHEFHIRDQQGNLRLAFRAGGQKSQQMRASMESVNSAQEEQQFENLASTRQLDPAHARTGAYAARLNAGQSQRMFGPSTSLAMHAGDSIRIEVYGRYDTKRGASAWPAVIPAVMANGPGQTQSMERVPSKTGFIPRIMAGLTIAWTALPRLLAGQERPPRASLKYDFFDQDSNLVATKVRYLEKEAKNGWQQLVLDYTAPKDGYMQVSMQNGTHQDAWFDDVSITTAEDMIVQENHYDPFGQNLAAIELQGNPNCDLQYTGKERVSESELEWVDYGARMYDPQLGRWHSDDPASQYASPYVAMGNNPVSMVDSDGKFAQFIIGALIGAYQGYQIGRSNGATGWGMFGYIAGGAAIGALSGGIGNGVATSGMAFQQTLGLMGASVISSMGMNALSGGQTGLSISLGVATYDVSGNRLGYLGRKGNSFLENLGYGLGAVGNLQDGLAGLHPGDVQMQFEYESPDGKIDPIGHAQVLNEQGAPLIDFGPKEGGTGAFIGMSAGRNNWTNYSSEGAVSQMKDKLGNKFTGSIPVKGVNLNRLARISENINNNPGSYNFLLRSCSSMSSRALGASGSIIFGGIHPYLLRTSLILKNAGVRPNLFSHYLTDKD